MSKLPINQADLIKLWQQVRSEAEEQSKDFGDVALQFHLAKQFLLPEILNLAAGKRDQGICVGLVTVLMAIHRNSDPGSKLSFLDWYPTTILPELSGLSAEEVTYQDLLSSMDYWTDGAIGHAEADITFKLAVDYQIGLHTLVWDSTSCYFDAQTNDLIKFGHSRDHRPDRPQIGSDMFIDPDSGMVPYERSYEGNTVDVDRFPVALEELHQQYPYLKHITLLLDRGPVSENSLALLKDLEYCVIAGLPQKGRWATLIEKIGSFADRFNLKGTRWQAIKKKVQIKVHEFYVHVFYNHKTAQKAQKLRQKALKACEKELTSLRLGQYKLTNREAIKERVNTVLLSHKVKPFLSVKVKKPHGQDKFHLEIAPKKRALSKAQKKDGRFAIITDHENLTSKEVLIKYRSKDKAESAFATLKGPVSLRPVFHYSPQRIKAHVFICHIALFLRNLLALMLKAKDIDLTPQKALKQAKKVHITQISFQEEEHTFWMLNKIDPDIQKIFDAIGLNPLQLLTAAGLSPP
jgi:transposase